MMCVYVSYSSECVQFPSHLQWVPCCAQIRSQQYSIYYWRKKEKTLCISLCVVAESTKIDKTKILMILRPRPFSRDNLLKKIVSVLESYVSVSPIIISHTPTFNGITTLKMDFVFFLHCQKIKNILEVSFYIIFSFYFIFILIVCFMTLPMEVITCHFVSLHASQQKNITWIIYFSYTIIP